MANESKILGFNYTYSELVDTIREIKDKYYDNLDELIMSRLDGASEVQVVETLKLRKDAFLRE